MFRISQFMQELKSPTPAGPRRHPPGPVVIWNLVRRCNLTCKHCYSISADVDFPGELNTGQVFEVMDDLKQFRVPVLILSGGEPLLRPDIYEISHRSKDMGFYTALSTNGTLIDKSNIRKIADVGYDYLGISIDGLRDIHDEVRQKQGAFDASMHAVRLCRDAGIKVGLRFTITQANAHQLPDLLELIERENIDKFYLSHLNYAGRGNKNRKTDLHHQMTRKAMDLMFDTVWADVETGRQREFVTGNNDADGVYLLHWVKRRFPEQYDHIHAKLVQWGGNASGVNVANIDNLGNVHPDTMWWNYNLGNVKDRPFSEIWMDTTDPLMAGLKQFPRQISGRCGVCEHRNICGGNTRTRAFQMTQDPWWEDPGCYLTDDELGIRPGQYENLQPQPLQLETRVVRYGS
ncbi:MAG: heme d1 biosynthesis radical SAM protein NirJ [Gammaproteobacteria bacterium]|nr:MAG: heme d1 biosynthesis radical SAM protein NirJ [Gammaproteobacteria bacterium]